MTDPHPEKHLLLQADLDGELDAAASASLAAHVAGCAECAELQRGLIALRRGLRAGLRPYAAPDSLRRRLAGAAAPEARVVPSAAPEARVVPFAAPRRGRGVRFAAPFSLGALLAAGLVLFLVPRMQATGEATDELVSDHIRALQPGHLMDVLSTDQHTVKPWFDGRIDFAPPVKDLAGQSFPLIGGRLDYVGGRPVAVLVYRRDKHLIDLFVWPASDKDGHDAAVGMRVRDGYNVLGWSAGGMVFRAVSDVEARELADFERDWRAQP